MSELTEHRQLIRSFVEGSGSPVSAKDLHRDLKGKINLATIYRGLRYLEGKGLIEGFTMNCSREGTVRYYFGNNVPHRHFFHCESCHRFIPFVPCTLGEDLNAFQETNRCVVYRHTLSLMGLCRACSSINGALQVIQK